MDAQKAEWLKEWWWFGHFAKPIVSYVSRVLSKNACPVSFILHMT